MGGGRLGGRGEGGKSGDRLGVVGGGGEVREVEREK